MGNGPFSGHVHPFSGWWLTYPSEKYDESSVGVMTFPTEWKVNPKSMVPVTTNQ